MKLKLGLIEKNILTTVLKKLDKHLEEQEGEKIELALYSINTWLAENEFLYELTIRDHVLIISLRKDHKA